jgi:predicted dehydrogenase
MNVKNHVVLIGVGNMGNKYLNVLKQLTNDIVLCDRDVNKILDKGFPYVCDIGDLNSPISKVIIATDPTQHVNIAKMLLKTGADILIEKPPATSYEEFISLSEFKNKIWISEIERFSLCIKEFPKHIKPKYIEIKRLNKGRGYINPIWDLAWHDLYNLLYLFGDVTIENVRVGHVWELTGKVNNETPFQLQVAWNHHFIDRSWTVHTNKGSIFMNFADEEIILENGTSYTRKDGNKLMDMLEQFLDGLEDESFDRAAKILKMLDNIKDEIGSI